jgi:zinc protease
LFVLEAEVPRDNSLEEVRVALINLTEQIDSAGVTAEEVNRARQQILKQRDLAAADTARMGIALSEWAAQGDWRLYFLHRDRIEKVTPEAVQAAAARYLLRNNRTVGLFIPSEKADRVAIPATPDLASLVSNYHGRAAVAEGEAFEATPEKIEGRAQREDFPSGIKVTLLPKKSRNQEAHLLLTLRYGDEKTLKGNESAAGFLSELMLRGTKSLTYQQLRDELDRLQATLGTGGGGGGGRRGGRGGAGGGGGAAGSVSFSIQAKHDTLPAVLALLRQVLREPALPAGEFEVMKRGRLATIEQMRSEPAMLAPRLLQRELSPYPRDDIRYVPTIEEGIERLKGVTYAQVTALYRNFLGGQAGELTIVGDFDPKVCLPIMKEALSDWPAAKPYERIAYPLTTAVAGSAHEIKTPDKANATYNAGLLLPLRDDDPDYPALLMGNYILGSGALSSRLGNRIRQQDGLSYGVSSSLSASSFDQRASFTITAICNPQNIGRLEKAVQEELARLLRDGVTQEELEAARKGYLQSQQVTRSSDAALAGILSALRHSGRTMTHEAGLEKKIYALTPETVNAALQKHIDPKKLVIVSAGDFETKPTTKPTATE